MNVRALAIRSLAVALAAITFAVPAARAQDAVVTADVAVTAAASVTASGPTTDAATVGVRRAAPANVVAEPPAISRNRGATLMIVGGAAILTGIVVGGDAGHAISIGGAVVGLIGLYQYLQ